jgi:hypothetical protein
MGQQRQLMHLSRNERGLEPVVERLEAARAQAIVAVLPGTTAQQATRATFVTHRAQFGSVRLAISLPPGKWRQFIAENPDDLGRHTFSLSGQLSYAGWFINRDQTASRSKLLSLFK